jgi:uncharacterized DUF497 family protein
MIWDTAKARANLAKHGVAFRDAQRVFDGPIMQVPDRRQDYGEDRFLAIGKEGEACLVVAFTRRGGTVRLISARKASKHERELHEHTIGTLAARYAPDGRRTP